MLNEVNKIFGRDFIVAYFLPSQAFMAVNIGMLYAFNLLPLWLQFDSAKPLEGTTILILVILSISFFLMAMNRLIFRTLEGYWPLNIGNHLNFIQRWRFRKLHRCLKELREERNQCKKEDKIFTKEDKLKRLMIRAAQRFPSKEKLVLFTSFGNTVRAFEDYPRVMYSFESINGWSRLNAVIPKDYRETLGSKRAMIDFWINIWFLSLVFIAEYLFLAVYLNSGFQYFWIPCASLIVVLVVSRQARIAAEQWGEWVKAAFDVFLPALYEKLGYKRPNNIQDEQIFCESLSQAIVYRHTPSLRKLEHWRKIQDESKADC